MIAVDTNILVHAHRADSPQHPAARDLIEALRRGRAAWAIPWPCVHEFLSVTTHPRIYREPTPPSTALAATSGWGAGRNLHFLAESPGYLEKLAALIRATGICGPLVHDARIAALCLHHGVSELWSADRDFRRFPQLKLRNPLLPRT